MTLRFRLRLFVTLVWVGIAVCGCGGSLPRVSANASTPGALELFEATLEAHGKASFDQLRNISVSYDGTWRELVTRFQPVLIDRAFRGTSDERIILADNVTAQAHRGKGGTKYVYRDANSVRVWYNGAAESDPEKTSAAAFVADGYRLFLLVPFYFLDKDAVFALAGEATINGKLCDILAIRARPGFGFSAGDDYALYIERQSRRVQRVRFTANGLSSLQGVVAEVDFFDYVQVGGVWWPTQFFERLKKPIPNVPVHEWRVTGLDVNRDYDVEAIRGPAFLNDAAQPAAMDYRKR